MPYTPPPVQDVRDLTGLTDPPVTDAQIQAAINTAGCLIEQTLACGCATGISDACLTRAATYIAAHILELSGAGGGAAGAKTEERFENYMVKFALSSASGDGIMATHYGQTANDLLGGCLMKLKNGAASVDFF